MDHKTPFLCSLVFSAAIAVCFFCGPGTIAQNSPSSAEEKLRPPSEETFNEARDLVVPWRSSGCLVINTEFREPNCVQIVGTPKYQSSDTLTLYSADGTLWYRFSLTQASPDYFLKNEKTHFKPFATEMEQYPQAVILRMVAESPHWYEVEVNETTRATKFVLKSDPLWAKTTWSYWLYTSYNLYLDSNHDPLRDKPGGEIVKDSADIKFKRVRFLKADGDWAYVQGMSGYPQKSYFGWIRWRSGRDVLVGYIFNRNTSSQTRTDEKNKSENGSISKRN